MLNWIDVQAERLRVFIVKANRAAHLGRWAAAGIRAQRSLLDQIHWTQSVWEDHIDLCIHASFPEELEHKGSELDRNLHTLTSSKLSKREDISLVSIVLKLKGITVDKQFLNRGPQTPRGFSQLAKEPAKNFGGKNLESTDLESTVLWRISNNYPHFLPYPYF